MPPLKKSIVSVKMGGCSNLLVIIDHFEVFSCRLVMVAMTLRADDVSYFH